MAGTEAEELEGIKQVLDGTTAGTPVLSLVTQLTAVVTQLTSLNSKIDTLNTRLSTGNTGLTAIKTSIDNVDVDVTVSDSDVADATVAQTRSRPPAEAPDDLRRQTKTQTRSARNPRKPGGA